MLRIQVTCHHSQKLGEEVRIILNLSDLKNPCSFLLSHLTSYGNQISYWLHFQPPYALWCIFFLIIVIFDAIKNGPSFYKGKIGSLLVSSDTQLGNRISYQICPMWTRTEVGKLSLVCQSNPAHLLLCFGPRARSRVYIYKRLKKIQRLYHGT